MQDIIKELRKIASDLNFFQRKIAARKLISLDLYRRIFAAGNVRPPSLTKERMNKEYMKKFLEHHGFTKALNHVPSRDCKRNCPSCLERESALKQLEKILPGYPNTDFFKAVLGAVNKKWSQIHTQGAKGEDKNTRAVDIMSELLVFKHIVENYKPSTGSSFTSYLYRAAMNEVIDSGKEIQGEQGQLRSLNEPVGAGSDATAKEKLDDLATDKMQDDPTSDTAYQEVMEKFERILKDKSGEKRKRGDAVNLLELFKHMVDGKTKTEIAEAIKRNVPTTVVNTQSIQSIFALEIAENSSDPQELSFLEGMMPRFVGIKTLGKKVKEIAEALADRRDKAGVAFVNKLIKKWEDIEDPGLSHFVDMILYETA